MSLEEAAVYEVALGLVPGVGNKNIRHLISYCGSAHGVFTRPPGKLAKIPGVGPVLVKRIKAHKNTCLARAEEELKKAEKLGVNILFYTHPNYPKRLKHLLDAPHLLYYKGTADLDSQKIVSLVGTRKSTRYGQKFIEYFIEELGRYKNLLVVSGLAYGIDILAHRECLKLGIPTVGVMANGIDRVYPPAHAATARQMLEGGGLLTENAIGSMPDAPKFPERNRIIAGLSDAVIVVEAGETGGALITADLANSYNIEVFAVPGPFNAPASKGCNKLLANHQAHILTSLNDFNKIMNWDVATAPKKSLPPVELTREEIRVMEVLQNGEVSIDLISYKAQVPISQLPALLINLELNGLIKPLPGNRYAKN